MKLKKESIWLAKFEIRQTLKHSVLQYFFLLCFSSLLLFSFPVYLEGRGFVGFDVAFLIIFGFVIGWMKTKHLQIQKIEGDLYASPFFLLLKQLPVKNEVLIQSRLLVFLFYVIPFHLLILFFLYVFIPQLREMLPLPNYLVFSLIWICYGVGFGVFFPAAEVGDKVPFLKSVGVTLLLFICMFVGLTVFNIVYGDGFVHFTMMLATEYPIFISLLSILFVVFSFIHCKRYMLKKMKTIDYF